jgi:cytochrome b subunit of formate dehydrogenase
MKDMRSQADLYAAKVRDLVGALTRDLLGALILVGFSLVAKFDRDHLQELIASPEVILFLRFLAAYFVLSAILQVVAHWRDASLAYKESASWLDALLHYTSRQDHEKRFISPLKARRRTLFVAMGIAAIIYLGAAAFFWYLPDVASIVLWRLRDPITVRFDFQG